MPRKRKNVRAQDYTVVDGVQEKDMKSVDNVPLKEVAFMPSTLETIDRALTNWLTEEMNIFATTHNGWEEVPVIWAGTERAYQIKHNKNLRDDRGQLLLPMITIERTGISKDPAKPGKLSAHIPRIVDGMRSVKGGAITVARRIQQDKTNNFATADGVKAKGDIGNRKIGNTTLNLPRKNKKIVYETVTMPLPTYIHVTYSVVLKAEYRQQINEMLTPFLVKTGQVNHFRLSHNEHQFEGFLPAEYSPNTNYADLGEDERMIENKIDIDVLGYLIGAGNNEKRPRVAIRENAVQIRFPRERTMVEDEHPQKSKDRFYRE